MSLPLARVACAGSTVLGRRLFTSVLCTPEATTPPPDRVLTMCAPIAAGSLLCSVQFANHGGTCSLLSPATVGTVYLLISRISIAHRGPKIISLLQPRLCLEWPAGGSLVLCGWVAVRREGKGVGRKWSSTPVMTTVACGLNMRTC